MDFSQLIDKSQNKYEYLNQMMNFFEILKIKFSMADGKWNTVIYEPIDFVDMILFVSEMVLFS